MVKGILSNNLVSEGGKEKPTALMVYHDLMVIFSEPLCIWSVILAKSTEYYSIKPCN